MMQVREFSAMEEGSGVFISSSLIAGVGMSDANPLGLPRREPGFGFTVYQYISGATL